MPKICKNPKCDYYGDTLCFAKRCKESCRNRRCVMFRKDHFAQTCRLKSEDNNCMKFVKYHPSGKPSFYEKDMSEGNDHEDYEESLSPEAKQIATDFYRQTLSTVTQHHHTQVQFSNQLMANHFHGSAQQPSPQMQKSEKTQNQSFNPFAGLPFSPFPPITGNNNIPQTGGWPFGQN